MTALPVWILDISSTLFDIEGLPASFLAHTLETPDSLKDFCAINNLNGNQSARLTQDLNIPIKPGMPNSEYETRLENLPLMPQSQQQGILIIISNQQPVTKPQD